MNENTFMERDKIYIMSNMEKQLEIQNKLAILDRLYDKDVITKESYVEGLKELLSKSSTKRRA